MRVHCGPKGQACTMGQKEEGRRVHWHLLCAYTCSESHQIHTHFCLSDGCPQDSSNRFYMWPESELGNVITLGCSCGTLNTTEINRQATRMCAGSYSQQVEWMPANTSLCTFDATTASLCNATTVGRFFMYRSLEYIIITSHTVVLMS